MNKPTTPKVLIDGPQKSSHTIVLAHGAGAGMDSEFMQAMAEGVAGCGIKVVRFEFPYMAQRRETGTRRPPDREPVLRETWLDLIRSLETNKLIIGGKSMGGRIASLIADEANASGQAIDVGRLLCLCDSEGPCANAVKDSQRTKTNPMTCRTLTLIWGTNKLPGHAAEVEAWYRRILKAFDSRIESVDIVG